MSSVTTQAPTRKMSPVLPLLGLTVIIGLLFILQLRHFSPFITDDAYISLRYSQRLLEGHGLTWNDMRPVEGYTNFLWVLLCSALGLLHIPLPLAAHILGISTTLLILVAIVLYIYLQYPAPLRFLGALLACMALVLSSPFSMWALGGLEQPLLACFLVWAAYLMLGWLESSHPSTYTASAIGLLLGLACLSRADASLFTAAFFVAAVVTDGISLSSILSRARILPIPILFSLGQLAFRRSYYHEWLPNTAFVKVAFTGHRLHTGLRYLYLALRINAVLFVLVLLASYALWHAGRRKPVLFLWTVALIWTAYLIVIGGDIFPAVRHFEPLVALFGFVLPGLAFFTQNPSCDASGRWKRGAMLALLAATALVATSDAMTDQEHWELQGESLGKFLNLAFGSRQPLLSSDAAGVVPYFAHMAALDPLGLNDYHIAHEASRARGYGWVGHELADGPYILDQKPDLLLFSSFDGNSELFPADQQIVDDPRFRQYYQAVRFDTPQPDSIRALLYLRRIDGKLGLQATADQVTIPAYLAKADLANSVPLVHGSATLIIAANGKASFTDLPATSGDWKVVLQSDNPSALTIEDPQGASNPNSCDACLRVPSSSRIGFTLKNQTHLPVQLSSITLRKQ